MAVGRARSASSPASGVPDGGRPGTNGDASARQSVIDATLVCICDLGYYRATSNQIAARAGVSWGAIAHHFGSRQALLLAALEDAVQRVLQDLEDVDLVGRTLREKIDTLFDLMFAFFGRREYLAVMQILWNLSRDPATRSSTMAALDEFANRLNRRWEEIFFDAVGRDVDPDLLRFAFTLIWGVALEEAASDLMRASEHSASRGKGERRKQLTIDTVEVVLSGRLGDS